MLEEAVASYRRALELKPDFVEAHSNLGNALREQGRLDDAVACYRRALELKPDYANAHCNLGLALQNQGKLTESLACYRRAVELDPDFVIAHGNRSRLRLLMGDFQLGWPEYEWRGGGRASAGTISASRRGKANPLGDKPACCTRSKGWATRSSSYVMRPSLSAGRHRGRRMPAAAAPAAGRVPRYRSLGRV